MKMPQDGFRTNSRHRASPRVIVSGQSVRELDEEEIATLGAFVSSVRALRLRSIENPALALYRRKRPL